MHSRQMSCQRKNMTRIRNSMKRKYVSNTKERNIRVSQCAKSMKNCTLSPDSRSLCQIHYKKAKNSIFDANLGVAHNRSILCSDFVNILLNKS